MESDYQQNKGGIKFRICNERNVKGTSYAQKEYHFSNEWAKAIKYDEFQVYGECSLCVLRFRKSLSSDGSSSRRWS